MGFMTIDGQRVEFTNEPNVLTVIRNAEIDIPTLCYHSELSIYGACRLCTVENDRGKTFASCAEPPRDGMVIYTNTPRLMRYRRTILELLLAAHDRDRTTCVKSGECHLLELAHRMGVDRIRFKNREAKYPIDESSPAIVRNPNKCILCGDCVRMCDNVQSVNAIDFAYRGTSTLVTPAFNKTIAQTNCVNCGQCRVVCPTGAISIKTNIDEVWDALADPNTIVVAQVAPAVRVALGDKFGIPVVNKRISVSPIGVVGASFSRDQMVRACQVLDESAKDAGVDFLGGFGALVEKGITPGERNLIDALPEALATTDRICSSINVASTRSGINMDAVALLGQRILDVAEATRDRDGLGCAKLVVFANAVEDNPFMAGAFHGAGEPECVINVGISGPGVVHHALQQVKGEPFDVVAETIKKTAFRITRMGQLVAREASARLEVPFGIVDLSLAPTPAVGDSVARILEEMGLEVCGTHGTTAALALLNDAVKKGGVMASNHVGGLSGAFIPVSEDEGMIAAAQQGALGLDKLEAMTCVCSVGLDMIAVPGDTSAETLSAIIADEAAIGMVNSKTTAVRLIPAPGKTVGDTVEFGGLLGSAPVMPVHPFGSAPFVSRGGRIPAPMQSLKN